MGRRVKLWDCVRWVSLVVWLELMGEMISGVWLNCVWLIVLNII